MKAMRITALFVATFVIILNLNSVTCQAVKESENKSYLEPFLGKKYELVYSDDKFDDIMKALGVGVIKRNFAKLAKPVMELTEHNGNYTLSSHSTFKDYSITFKIGEELEHITPDDRSVKCMFTQDKNKLTEIEEGAKTTVVVREFFDDEVIVTTQVDDIVSVRKYKRL